MMDTQVKSRSCRDLLSLMPATTPTPSGKLLFSGLDGMDVYNITAPFEFNGETLLAGRVEHRDTEFAEIVIFRQAGETWAPHPAAPVFKHLQDPCFTFVDGELILGGVKYPVTLDDGTTGWRMEFYRGKTVSSMTLFLTGPDKMKDIRLKQIPDGRIAVFSRPQGKRGGMGQIGFTIVPGLEDVTLEAIEAAPLYEHLFPAAEWGGANEIHLLKNGGLGVLGHMAYLDDREHRHYHAIVFVVDPVSGEATAPRIIARRKDLPTGPAKRPDLVDVIFSGGLVRSGNGHATLYAGLSDAEAGWVTLEDPFLPFER